MDAYHNASTTYFTLFFFDRLFSAAFFPVRLSEKSVSTTSNKPMVPDVGLRSHGDLFVHCTWASGNLGTKKIAGTTLGLELSGEFFKFLGHNP